MKPFKPTTIMAILALQIFLNSVPVKAEPSNSNAIVVDTVESNDVTKKTFLEKTLDLYIKGQKYLKTAQKYVDLDLKKFRIKWGTINTELGKAIDKAILDGKKDPVSTGEEVNDAVSRQEDPDLINISPKVQGEQAERDVHQSYSRAQSQAVLGIEGQKNQVEEAEISNTAVTDSLEQADAAQGDVVSQDILKKMAVQNLQMAMLTKSVHGEAQKQTQFLAITNMNLANISEQMSIEERKKQAESSATSREILRAGSASDAFWKNQ